MIVISSSTKFKEINIRRTIFYVQFCMVRFTVSWKCFPFRVTTNTLLKCMSVKTQNITKYHRKCLTLSSKMFCQIWNSNSFFFQWRSICKTSSDLKEALYLLFYTHFLNHFCLVHIPQQATLSEGGARTFWKFRYQSVRNKWQNV